MKCYNCGNISVPDYMETCPQCNAYIRCCKNCEEYDEYASGNCKAGKWETNKNTKNFCDLFKPNTLSW